MKGKKYANRKHFNAMWRRSLRMAGWSKREADEIIWHCKQFPVDKAQATLMELCE